MVVRYTECLNFLFITDLIRWAVKKICIRMVLPNRWVEWTDTLLKLMPHYVEIEGRWLLHGVKKTSSSCMRDLELSNRCLKFTSLPVPILFLVFPLTSFLPYPKLITLSTTTCYWSSSNNKNSIKSISRHTETYTNILTYTYNEQQIMNHRLILMIAAWYKQTATASIRMRNHMYEFTMVKA